MAARNFTEAQLTMNRDSVELTARCVGAAGANPTGFKGLGVASITWVSTGKYRVTLQDKYMGLLGANFKVIDSTGTKHFSITITSETVATTKVIEFEVYSAISGTAPTRANLATTETLLVEVKLSNTSQRPRGF